MNRVIAKYALLLLVVSIAAGIGCARIYEKYYRLSEENLVEATFEGREIKFLLESRVAGYTGSRNSFRLDIVVDDQNVTDANPAGEVEFDSVCVRYGDPSLTHCFELVETRQKLDNMYTRTRPLKILQYDYVELAKSDIFVRLTATMNLRNETTGEVVSSRPVEFELQRFVNRAFD